MFSRAELIQALQRRLQLVVRRSHPPGEFPPPWQSWLDAMAAPPGRVVGAPPDAFVATFLARPLATPPRRLESMTRWQAFSAVWRQQWHAKEPAERGLRAGSGLGSLLLHLVLAVMLVWLLDAPMPLERAQRQGEDVVQVEF
ncbi:MAG: hypothetical protein M3Q40_10295, partial [Pseudomonadota bacterium]|nr:hypothetical protein [Pseudomonadota bacterium]